MPVEQLARLFASQHRCLATLDHMLRPADRMGRIGGQHLAGDEPVEKHANGGQVLLHRRLFVADQLRLNVGRNMQRLDVVDTAELVVVGPGEELADRPVVGHARVLVPNGRREEFQEPPGGLGRRRRR